VRVPRELVAANAAALLVLVLAMLLGWHEAALFGLVTLVIMNLLVVLRGRQARHPTVPKEPEESLEEREREEHD
jgi:ABC-type phosphate transport system permease subunit